MNSKFCEGGEETHVWNQMLWLGLHVTVGSRRVEESLVRALCLGLVISCYTRCVSDA